MTTQQETSTPFGNKNEHTTLETNDIFSLRTMQDDLLNIQSKGIIKEETVLPQAAPITPQKTESVNPGSISSKSISPFPQPTQAITPQKTIAEVKPSPQKTVEPSNPISKIVIAIIVLLVIIVVALGGYYFFLTNQPKQVAQPAVTQPIQTEQPIVAEPAVTPIVTDKYSANKPNYLTMDLATLSTSEIQKIISDTAAELTGSSSQAPYEFTIVDANNNPVAFPIFATAAKINLTPTLLKTLSENFSLFIYNDAGNIRLGISATIANPSVLSMEIKKQESTFVTDASTLFLGTAPTITTGTFTESTYNGNTIRYLNVNNAKNLSIDYTITGSQLIIGTSKNTLRAILDKLATAPLPSTTTTAAPQIITPTPSNNPTDPNIQTQALNTTTPADNIPPAIN